MAFFADDLRDWQYDEWVRYSADGQDQEDVIFGTVEDDEPDNAHELMTNAMHPIEISLDLVERLSWDSSSECSTDEVEQASDLNFPTLLPLQVDAVLEDNNLRTGLISPNSGTSLSSLTRVSISSPIHQLRFFEPDLEYEGTGHLSLPFTQQLNEKEGDRKVTHCVDPKTCLSSTATCQGAEFVEIRTNVISDNTCHETSNLSSTTTRQPAESVEIRTKVISDSKSHENNLGSADHPSQVPSIAHWRRHNDRTCSGAGSIGMPKALPFTERTHSISCLRSPSFDDEDDGDFSSDDEGYSPEVHHYCTSKTGPLNAKLRRRASLTSMNFSSQRLSVNMNPAIIKRLQEAKDKLRYGLELLRSRSSVSTVTSEESYVDSPAC
ncbi:hypothetical protein PsorP6_002760 [Peronosclerospora sorghi]|uniref:Uncharacterized protein n=1 Tax=Peronosclerospora sorghi TaxID=230839 RepID=A0ACC0VPG4_9STRA|nr:hypothetical protein PsorP6_002760 [Peronosclerospora sorghi]